MDYRYCPQCGAEYRQGFDRCSDCDVELVDEPPAADEDEENFAVLDPLHPDYAYRESDWVGDVEPVVVYHASRDMDAEVVLSVLRAHELRAFASKTGLHSSHGGGGPGPSIPIWAHPDDAEAARELLRYSELTGAQTWDEPVFEDAEAEGASDYDVADSEDDVDTGPGPLAAPNTMSGMLKRIGAAIVLLVLGIAIANATCDAADLSGL